MMGYAMLEQKTAGIHQRLRSRAFVIASPCHGRRVAFVSADAGFIAQGVRQQVVERLRATYGALYSDENVVLSATHSGPGGFSHYALYNLTVLGFDKRMTRLRLQSSTGQEVGLINWFAVHTTSMGNDKLLISGDNKGYGVLPLREAPGHQLHGREDVRGRLRSEQRGRRDAQHLRRGERRRGQRLREHRAVHTSVRPRGGGPVSRRFPAPSTPEQGPCPFRQSRRETRRGKTCCPQARPSHKRLLGHGDERALRAAGD